MSYKLKRLLVKVRRNVAVGKASTATLVLALMFSTLGNAQDSTIGWMFINENTIALDKQMHFVGGAGVSAVTYAIALDHNGGRRGNAKMWGIISSVAIGTLKEAMDSGSGGTGFDWADIGYTVAGGIVGTYSFDILANRAKKRQLKRLEELKNQ